jgi:hypothetical protein
MPAVVEVLGQHVLLGLSVAALGATGLWIAGALDARGLPRVLAAAALGWAAAVVHALALGLVDLEGSPVALAWAIGVSGSWVAASIVNVALLALLVVAGFVGLRGAGVDAPEAGLGAAALAALPLLTTQLGGPATDLPAVAWLVVAAALACVAARGWGTQPPSPGLLAIALVAAGLAIGTKTTTALLLLGGLVAPLVRRSRTALIAAGITVLAVASWTFAPYTGLEEETLAVGGLRYLLPALAAATAALCLASVGAGRTLRHAVAAVLGLALVLSLQRTLTAGFSVAPALATVLALAVLGAGAGLLAGRLRQPAWAWAAPAAAVVAGTARSIAAGGYVQRHAEVGLFDAGLLRTLPAQQAAGAAPLAMGPVTLPLVAGDDLAREIVPLAGGADCPTVRRHAAEGLLALQHTPATAAYAALRSCVADRAPGWRDGNWELYGLRDGAAP